MTSPINVPSGHGLFVIAGGQQPAKYDEAEFLVGGRGVGKGDMESVTFKIHEGYVAEMDKWWKSKKFPYKSMSDIVRHAVVRHVRYFLPALEGEVEGTLIHELTSMDETTARWKFQNMFVRHIESIAEQVNATLAMPDGRMEVERMLRVYQRRLESIKPSYFKRVYEKQFNDRFGVYLSRIVLLDGGGSEQSVIDLPPFDEIEASMGGRAYVDFDDDDDDDDGNKR